MTDVVSVPEVATHAQRAGDGRWVLILACPHCGRRHVHGGGRDDAPDYGPRVAHCGGRERAADYVLIAAPDGMPRPVARPRAGRGKRLPEVASRDAHETYPSQLRKRRRPMSLDTLGGSVVRVAEAS